MLVWNYYSRRDLIEQHKKLVKLLQIQQAEERNLFENSNKQEDYELLQNKLTILKHQTDWLNALERSH